jgi:hypothetical protein
MELTQKELDEIQELFSNQNDSDSCDLNIARSHFSEKHDIIKRQLFSFVDRLKWATQKERETDKEIRTEKTNNFPIKEITDADILPLLKEILSGEYKPPQSLPEYHMWTLLHFYSYVAPALKEIHLPALLKIDIATLRLFEVFIHESENMKNSVIEDSRIRKVINTKEKIKQANEKYILNALKDMGVQYDGNNPKKPFIFEGVERTVNYVGDKLNIDTLSRDYIKKTIRRMKDEGKLSPLRCSKSI